MAFYLLNGILFCPSKINCCILGVKIFLEGQTCWLTPPLSLLGEVTADPWYLEQTKKKLVKVRARGMRVQIFYCIECQLWQPWMLKISFVWNPASETRQAEPEAVRLASRGGYCTRRFLQPRLFLPSGKTHPSALHWQAPCACSSSYSVFHIYWMYLCLETAVLFMCSVCGGWGVCDLPPAWGHWVVVI